MSQRCGDKLINHPTPRTLVWGALVTFQFDKKPRGLTCFLRQLLFEFPFFTSSFHETSCQMIFNSSQITLNAVIYMFFSLCLEMCSVFSSASCFNSLHIYTCDIIALALIAVELHHHQVKIWICPTFWLIINVYFSLNCLLSFVPISKCKHTKLRCVHIQSSPDHDPNHPLYFFFEAFLSTLIFKKSLKNTVLPSNISPLTHTPSLWTLESNRAGIIQNVC